MATRDEHGTLDFATDAVLTQGSGRVPFRVLGIRTTTVSVGHGLDEEAGLVIDNSLALASLDDLRQTVTAFRDEVAQRFERVEGTLAGLGRPSATAAVADQGIEGYVAHLSSWAQDLLVRGGADLPAYAGQMAADIEAT